MRATRRADSAKTKSRSTVTYPLCTRVCVVLQPVLRSAKRSPEQPPFRDLVAWERPTSAAATGYRSHSQIKAERPPHGTSLSLPSRRSHRNMFPITTRCPVDLAAKEGTQAVVLRRRPRLPRTPRRYHRSRIRAIASGQQAFSQTQVPPATQCEPGDLLDGRRDPGRHATGTRGCSISA